MLLLEALWLLFSLPCNLCVSVRFERVSMLLPPASCCNLVGFCGRSTAWCCDLKGMSAHSPKRLLRRLCACACKLFYARNGQEKDSFSTYLFSLSAPSL